MQHPALLPKHPSTTLDQLARMAIMDTYRYTHACAHTHLSTKIRLDNVFQKREILERQYVT